MPANFNSVDDITEIISLGGGGVSAVVYAHGVLWALHRSGQLMTSENGILTLKKDKMFIGSSGGTIPILLLDLICKNDLQNSREDWFEYYITNALDKMQTLQMTSIYLAITARSFNIYNNIMFESTRLLGDFIRTIIDSVLSPELTHGKALTFCTNNCSLFRYNYVVDSAFDDMPIVSNDFTHLNNMSAMTQIAEILSTCCIAISFSLLKNGILNDAALLIDSDILKLDQYTNLKHIYYYSLTAYDATTNNSYRERLFSLQNVFSRFTRINNYRAINNLALYCKDPRNLSKNIQFTLITLPNKYNPIRKFNNKIYNDLVPSMFYQTDYSDISRVTGYLNGDVRVLRLVSIIAALETIYVRGISIDIANNITDKLPQLYKEAFKDPYKIYFKTDLVSAITRTLNI